jgi:hypothetical protein
MHVGVAFWTSAVVRGMLLHTFTGCVLFSFRLIIKALVVAVVIRIPSSTDYMVSSRETY